MSEILALSSSSILDPPYGAHPSIVTTVRLPELGSNSTCTLLLQYTLPPLLFVDKYELEMRSQEYQIAGLSGRGAKELEKPAHTLPVIEELGNDIGVELVVKKEVKSALVGGIEVHLPIHVRYGEPVTSKESIPSTVQALEPPQLVLTCRGDVSSCSNEDNAPNYALSFVAALDEPRSVCVAKSSTSEPLTLSVPLGNKLDLPMVEFGTSAVILACFVWIALEAWKASRRLRTAEGKGKSD